MRHYRFSLSFRREQPEVATRRLHARFSIRHHQTAQIARDPRPDSQARSRPAAPARKQNIAGRGRPANIAAQPTAVSGPSEKSVLRRTSLEEEIREPAELAIDAAEASPIGPPPLPSIPANPLRAGR
jgi:hypothetical protein